MSHQLGFEQLSEYFHLPINEVSTRLGVCATVLKKICRKNGIPRWPHRKIKSLERMIKVLEMTVTSSPEEAEQIQKEIIKMKRKKEYILKNPLPLNEKLSKDSQKKSIKAIRFQYHSLNSSQTSSGEEREHEENNTEEYIQQEKSGEIEEIASSVMANFKPSANFQSSALETESSNNSSGQPCALPKIANLFELLPPLQRYPDNWWNIPDLKNPVAVIHLPVLEPKI